MLHFEKESRASARPDATVTLKLQTTLFPEGSVAWQLTVVTPRLKVEPEAGVQVTVKFESQLS